MEYPPLADLVRGKWPDDVIARAEQLQAEIGSVGAYSHSQGIPLIRKHVAQFIEGASSLRVSRPLADHPHRARRLP